jgi:hypothetical protein
VLPDVVRRAAQFELLRSQPLRQQQWEWNLHKT